MERKSPMLQEGDLVKRSPIVEQPDRPDWLWERPRAILPGTPEARREIMDYIEFLERELAGHRLMRTGYIDELSKYSLETATLTNELHQAKAIIEGLTAERNRAEQFAKDIEKGLKVSHKSLEKEIDI